MSDGSPPETPRSQLQRWPAHRPHTSCPPSPPPSGTSLCASRRDYGHTTRSRGSPTLWRWATLIGYLPCRASLDRKEESKAQPTIPGKAEAGVLFSTFLKTWPPSGRAGCAQGSAARLQTVTLCAILRISNTQHTVALPLPTRGSQDGHHSTSKQYRTPCNPPSPLLWR